MAGERIADTEGGAERFGVAYDRLVEMLAHVVPLDITLQSGWSPTQGRVEVKAQLPTSEAPKSIVRTAFRYEEVGPGAYHATRSIQTLYAVDNETTASNLQGAHVPTDPDSFGKIYDAIETVYIEGGINRIKQEADHLY